MKACEPGDQAFADETGFGLTKREYFAAYAMQGLCAALAYRPGVSINSQEVVSDAVDIAEALIAELNK